MVEQVRLVECSTPVLLNVTWGENTVSMGNEGKVWWKKVEEGAGCKVRAVEKWYGWWCGVVDWMRGIQSVLSLVLDLKPSLFCGKQ